MQLPKILHELVDLIHDLKGVEPAKRAELHELIDQVPVVRADVEADVKTVEGQVAQDTATVEGQVSQVEGAAADGPAA